MLKVAIFLLCLAVSCSSQYSTPATRLLVTDTALYKQCRPHHANAKQTITEAETKFETCMQHKIMTLFMALRGGSYTCSNLVDSTMKCIEAYFIDISMCISNELKEDLTQYARSVIQTICHNMETLRENKDEILQCSTNVGEKLKDCHVNGIDFYSKLDSSSCRSLKTSLECYTKAVKSCGDKVQNLLKNTLLDSLRQHFCKRLDISFDFQSSGNYISISLFYLILTLMISSYVK